MSDSRYGFHGMSAPGYGEVPHVDDRLVMPESRAEILNGRLLVAAPADPPHAKAHLDLGCLMRLHVAPGYIAATDMLTRTSRENDFAPDVSVFAEGEPRKLEELAFEVTSEQALKIPTEKARELVRRGVRRVFAVLVKQRRVLEWSRDTDGWRTVPDSATLEDRCLVRPIAIRALVDAAAVEDESARALLARNNLIVARAIEDAATEAEARGLREAVRAAATLLALPIDDARAAELESMDSTMLRALIARLTNLRAWD